MLSASDCAKHSTGRIRARLDTVSVWQKSFRLNDELDTSAERNLVV